MEKVSVGGCGLKYCYHVGIRWKRKSKNKCCYVETNGKICDKCSAVTHLFNVLLNKWSGAVRCPFIIYSV